MAWSVGFRFLFVSQKSALHVVHTLVFYRGELLPVGSASATTPPAGFFVGKVMPIIEPQVKRVVAFIDGQNLFNAAKETFGYHYPNFDPLRLTEEVCALRSGWVLAGVHFYTGMPRSEEDPIRHDFWSRKLAVMGTRGVRIFTRSLRYSDKVIALPNGAFTTARVGREKGIDVRIALDIVRYALENRCDVALVFSQDQDLSEAAEEVRWISQRDQRWIRVASAYPFSPTCNNRRGINGTDWIKIDRPTYDRCVDPNDYRVREK